MKSQILDAGSYMMLRITTDADELKGTVMTHAHSKKYCAQRADGCTQSFKDCDDAVLWVSA
jgi:hypothetical protein